jgi:dTDP-4-dehydrorhamnose 3,5-epimerase-like enzyme
MQITSPFLIPFKGIGHPEIGYLSVAENTQNIPFEIKRVFWTYYTPQDICRGRHAHHETQIIIVAVHGSIMVETEMIDGEKCNFQLNSPNIGLYLPILCWHTLQYSHDAVQMVMASTNYDANDYIRDYEGFRKILK